ncbi:uncharacterized protein LOC121991273 [Zingiber officinale]|uniref:uncharacterized protein LOC121991273 n=1 Tax=Zingiber officinale TaxID=94328 RepID=UPI001C4BC5EE|nr:uncharacterized protein LOC121991273 [Zingiber officinale]
MEHLREICKCLKTLVDFLLCHCDSLSKHDPKPWDPPFDLSQPKLDLSLAVIVVVFLFVVTALSSHYHHGELFARVQPTGGGGHREQQFVGAVIGLPDLSVCAVEEEEQQQDQVRWWKHRQQQLLAYTAATSLARRRRVQIQTEKSMLQICLGGKHLFVLQLTLASSMNMFDGNKIGFLVDVLNAIRLDFGWNKLSVYDGSTLVTMQGNIEFRNVYFNYLSRPEILILSGFYQNVPARKTVALVGRNDSRKSSIIPLMERFYDLTLVTQEPTLLSLSIKDNIAYGRSAIFDQIEEVAKTIHAHDFITSLEMGYETQFALDSVKSLQVLSIFCIYVTEIPIDLFQEVNWLFVQVSSCSCIVSNGLQEVPAIH